MASTIKAKGFKPGLWIAPFAADKGSALAKDHPDWIIRTENGRPSNSGNCAKFFYGLDATNPEVVEHARAAVKRAVGWGYEVLKVRGGFLQRATSDAPPATEVPLSRLGSR